MIEYQAKTSEKSMRTLGHFSYYNPDDNSLIAPNANAGDTMLHDATRKLFDTAFGLNKWLIELVWQEVTTKTVDEFNSRAKAIVLGGGGLLLRDQKGAEKSCSGWQWNCPLPQLKQIMVPLIIIGIGYNRFRNQEDFEPEFTDHINAVVEKSSFFGLRNTGSIEAVKKYLRPELHSKLSWQPCPTTIASFIYPEFQNSASKRGSDLAMAINIAFDRRDMRFGSAQRENQALTEIARVLKNFQQKGWTISLVNHKPTGEEFIKWLAKENVPYTAVDLYDATPSEIMNFYAKQKVVVGMRGHAQMIPFGLQKNIVSIISHNKMQWFLEDIKHPEWGVDVNDPNFESKLNDTLTDVAVTRYDTVNKEVIAAQQALWKITQANLDIIRSFIS